MAKDKSINHIVLILIKPFGLWQFKYTFKKDICFSAYTPDHIEEKHLLKLLKKSIWSIQLREAILEILCLTKETSITESVFQFCLRYPGRFKKNLIIQLSHMWLRKEHLEIINPLLDTPEAFCKLLIMNTKDNSCSINDFSIFLEKNRRFSKAINYLDMVKQWCPNISNDKYNALADWMGCT